MRVEFRTTNRTRVLAALLGIVMLLPAVKLQAQASTAAMNGRVLDEQGGALPGVTVVLRGQETGLFRETVSTQNGTYNFVGMTPGVYQVEAEWLQEVPAREHPTRGRQDREHGFDVGDRTAQ
jgi:hypothetical protein